MSTYQNFWLFQALDIYADTNSQNIGLNIQINGLSPSGLDYNVSRKVLSTLDFRKGILPGGDIALGVWFIYDNTDNILNDISLSNTSSMIYQNSEAYRFRGGYINIIPFYQKSDNSLGIGRFNFDFRTTAIPEISPFWSIVNLSNGTATPLSNPTSDFVTGIYQDTTEINSFGYIIKNNRNLINYNVNNLTVGFTLSASYLTRSQKKNISMLVTPKIILDIDHTTTSLLEKTSNLGEYTGPWIDWSKKAMVVSNPQTFVMNHVSIQRPQWITYTKRLDYKFNANPHPFFLMNGPGHLNTLGASAIWNKSLIPWKRNYLDAPSYISPIDLNVSTSRIEITNTGINYWIHNSVTGQPNTPYWSQPHPVSESMYGDTGIWLYTGQTGTFNYIAYNGEDAPSGYYPDILTANNVATVGPKLSQNMGWSKIVDFSTGPVLLNTSIVSNFNTKTTYSPITGLYWNNDYNTLIFNGYQPTPIALCDGVNVGISETILLGNGYLGVGAGIMTFYSSQISTGNYTNSLSRDTSKLLVLDLNQTYLPDGILTTYIIPSLSFGLVVGKSYTLVLNIPAGDFTCDTTFLIKNGVDTLAPDIDYVPCDSYVRTIVFTASSTTLYLTVSEDWSFTSGQFQVYLNNNLISYGTYPATYLWDKKVKISQGINNNKIYVLNHNNVRPWNSYDTHNFSPTSYFSLTGPKPLNDILWGESIYFPSTITNNYDALRWDGWPPTYHFTNLSGITTYNYYDYPKYSGDGISITGNTFIYTPEISNNLLTGLTAIPYMRNLYGNNKITSNIPIPLTSPTGPLILLLTGPSWGNTLPIMAHITGPRVGFTPLSTGSFLSSNPTSWTGITQTFYWDVPYQENLTDYGLSTYIQMKKSMSSKWSLGEDTGISDLIRPSSGTIYYNGSLFDFGYGWQAPLFPSGINFNERANQLIDIGNQKALIKMNQYDVAWGYTSYWKLDASVFPHTFDSIPSMDTSFTLGPNLLNGTGWTSTNWTGSYLLGWGHTTGNTSALSRSISHFTNRFYTITVNIRNRTAGSITVSFGSVTTSPISFNGNTINNIYTVSSGLITITPTSNFDGIVMIYLQLATSVPLVVSETDSTVWDFYKNQSVLVSNSDLRVFTIDFPTGTYKDSGLLNMWNLIATQPTGIQFSTGGVFNDFIFSDRNFRRDDNLRIYSKSLFGNNIGPTGITGSDYVLTFYNQFNGSTSVKYATSITQKFYSSPVFTEKPIGYNYISYTGWTDTNKLNTRLGWTQMDTTVYSSTGGIKPLTGIGNSLWDIDWIYYNNSIKLTGGTGYTHKYSLVDTLDRNNYPIGGNIIIDLPTGPSIPEGLYYAKMRAGIDINPETNYTGTTGMTTPTNFRILGKPSGNMYSNNIVVGFSSPSVGIGSLQCYFDTMYNFCSSTVYNYTSGNDISMEFRLIIDTIGEIGTIYFASPLPKLTQLNSNNTVRTTGVDPHSGLFYVVIDLGQCSEYANSESDGDYSFNGIDAIPLTHRIQTRLKIYYNRNPSTTLYNTQNNSIYTANEFVYTDWIEIGNFIPVPGSTLIFDV